MSTNIVGRRALKIALGVSLVFLLVSAALFFSYEYGRRITHIDDEIQTLREAQTSGIVEGLWNYDTYLLQALADGFNFHPHINYVAIEDKAGLVVESGARKEKNSLRKYPLTREMPDVGDVELGTLSVEIDSLQILSDVTGQVLASLLFQTLFMAVVSFIVLLLFSRMVTRHLATIAEHIRTFDARPGAPSLALEKRDRGDELDILVQSFNTMHGNLDAAHSAEARAMEELRISEELNRVLVDEAPDAILMLDCRTMRFISCNRRAEELFRRSQEELIHILPSELYTPIQPDGQSMEQNVAAATSQAIAGEPVLARRNVLRPDGTILTCEVRLTLLPSEGRKILRVSYLDITDRVRAEEEVARSLREKETLLQEVYHRTKNNMQLIAAFLNMESLSCGDERTSKILNKMIGRITSMALVHQKLYQSKDLSRIDFGEYLEELVQEIRQAYLTARPGVRILVEAEPGIVSLLDTAIPCGLALNELIVNAVKYAFPENRPGTIRVGFSRGRPGMLEFSVADDGVGFPPGFDYRRDGKIGLQTVVSLIEQQLHGKIEFGAGAGTVCTATIRDNLYSARV